MTPKYGLPGIKEARGLVPFLLAYPVDTRTRHPFAKAASPLGILPRRRPWTGLSRRGPPLDRETLAFYASFT